jgi:hypothetical protein
MEAARIAEYDALERSSEDQATVPRDVAEAKRRDRLGPITRNSWLEQ